MDGMAKVGLFGAVSSSTLAAGMAMLDGAGVAYKGFIGALYPFMDVDALVTAIVWAKLAEQRRSATSVQGWTMTLGGSGDVRGPAPALDTELVQTILRDTFQSLAISALILGIGLGILARPDSVNTSF